MDHDSEGAYFVEYTVEEFEKFLIIYLECHDPYKIHIMYTFSPMAHTKYT
jgi:hypothetical protein